MGFFKSLGRDKRTDTANTESAEEPRVFAADLSAGDSSEGEQASEAACASESAQADSTAAASNSAEVGDGAASDDIVQVLDVIEIVGAAEAKVTEPKAVDAEEADVEEADAEAVEKEEADAKAADAEDSDAPLPDESASEEGEQDEDDLNKPQKIDDDSSVVAAEVASAVEEPADEQADDAADEQVDAPVDEQADAAPADQADAAVDDQAVEEYLVALEEAEESIGDEAEGKHAGGTKKGKHGKSKGKHSRGKHAGAPVELPATDYEAALTSGVDLPEGFAAIPSRKKGRVLKAIGISVGVVAALLCVAYVAGVIVFMGRFFPHTILGDHDISLKTNEEVVQMLDDAAASYEIDVRAPGFDYHTTGADLDLNINSESIVRAIHMQLDPWKWPLLIFEPSHDVSDQLTVTFNRTFYEQPLREAVAEYNKTATPPVNATIAYDEAQNKFVPKEEEIGTQIDADALLSAIAQSILTLDSEFVLTDAQLMQPTVRVTDEKLIESAKLATGMTSVDIKLNMAGKPVGEITSKDLSRFIAIDDKMDVTFKEDELNAWCDELAASFNTVGSERTFTRADGKVITVSGGVYGWEIDQSALRDAIIEKIKAGEAAEMDVPFVTEAASYLGAGQRDWGNRYIDVDISEQHVRFYDANGALFWETDCITGMPDGSHDTVTGVWTVNGKSSPSKLVGYENGQKIYETTVTYWMPFEQNSIGFHDATWQPSFGGTMYANGYGSHGCVNLSYDAAQELYGIIETGDVVVVHF